MAVCVVAIHTQPLYGIKSAVVQRLFDTITSLAVLYFFSVSGFLLFSKIDTDISSEKNIEVCKKYLSRVLSLYVIWNIIYLPITIFEFKENNMSFARYVLDCIRGFLFIGQQFYSWQLWYLLSVFFVIASICMMWTRIIEYKWFEFGKDENGNDLPKTIISREYSSEWKPGDEPYYPVNDAQNSLLYSEYKKLADSEEKVIFGGRLGEYKYYDMDQVIAVVLERCEKEPW